MKWNFPQDAAGISCVNQCMGLLKYVRCRLLLGFEGVRSSEERDERDSVER